MRQRTLRKEYEFEGKSLHTGQYSRICVKPAPENTGIVFRCADTGVVVPALADYVTRTSRSTLLSKDGVTVGTVEHLLSALTGLGVDNAEVEMIEGKELPILDGSAGPYVDAILPDGLEEQGEDRHWIELSEPITFTNPKSGAYVKIEPAEEFSYEVTIDFNSRVLGVQTVRWNPSVDFASQIAPCRTFCFLHEIQLLAQLGLVKGGDVRNAIIVVEKPVGERTLARIARSFGQPELGVTEKGYLNNLELHFDDECGRHKMLDIIGDLRLVGGFLKARVTAYKPGHGLNTGAALEIRKKSN